MLLDCPLSVKLSWQCFELVSKAFRFDGARFLEFAVLTTAQVAGNGIGNMITHNLYVNHLLLYCTELEGCC